MASLPQQRQSPEDGSVTQQKMQFHPVYFSFSFPET
uniref:Uncharacterized protein n=1 Tax=Anguilla anguilla TaxID=7936 RepID=A0A0E9W3S1_ANGAN